MITCIDYENISIIYTWLQKCTGIASRETYVMRVKVPIRYCNRDYTGLKWGGNIGIFW